MFNKENSVFLLGGKDLEMQEIKKTILHLTRQQSFPVKQLSDTIFVSKSSDR